MLIIFGKWRSLFFVHGQPLQNNRRHIVGALEQFTVAAGTMSHWLFECHRVWSITRAAFTAAGHPAYNFVVLERWLNNNREWTMQFAEHIIQSGGLSSSAREAIQQEAMIAGKGLQTATYQRDDDVISDELTVFDRGFGLEPQRCFGCDLGTEYVAG